MIRAAAFRILRVSIRASRALGWDVMSTRFAAVRRAYNACYDSLRPRGIVAASTRIGRIQVDADQRGAAPKLLIHGTYEPSVESALAAYVRPGAVVVDVGANVGYLTRFAADCAGSGGQVYALEPDPLNFALLESNCAHIPGIRCFPLGVAAEAGRSSFYRDHRSNTRSSLAPLPGRPMYQAGTVETVMLDEWATSNGVNLDSIDVVKIDVEGGELEVLRGASTVLHHRRAVFIVELWPIGLVAHGASFHEVIAMFEAHGYRARPIGAEQPWPLLQPSELVPPQRYETHKCRVCAPRTVLTSSQSTVATLLCLVAGRQFFDALARLDRHGCSPAPFTSSSDRRRNRELQLFGSSHDALRKVEAEIH